MKKSTFIPVYLVLVLIALLTSCKTLDNQQSANSRRVTNEDQTTRWIYKYPVELVTKDGDTIVEWRYSRSRFSHDRHAFSFTK